MRKWLAAALMLAALACCAARAEAQAYRTATFGAFEQDGDPGNGPEPIEWIVLREDGGVATLLSRYVLDASIYDDETYKRDPGGVLSDWLNGDFLDTAFDADQRARLVPVRNTYQALASEDWEDVEVEETAFLPARGEIEALPDALRRATPTPYAAQRGLWVQDVGAYRGNCLYWLREFDDYGAMAVDCAGAVFGGDYDTGLPFKSGYVGVRPVVVARLPESAYAGALAEAGNAPESPRDPSGDWVRFGWYEQGKPYGPIGEGSDYAFTGGAPLEWEVLFESGDTLVMISRDILRLMPYSANPGDGWADSTLRSWLNGPFLDAAFPDEERALLVPRTGPDGATDLASLLTPREALRAIATGWDMRTGCTGLAKCWMAYESSVEDWHHWWLRDGTLMGFTGAFPWTLDEDEVSYLPDRIGVRPVIEVRATRAQLAELANTIDRRADRASMPHPDVHRVLREPAVDTLTLRAAPDPDAPVLATLPAPEAVPTRGCEKTPPTARLGRWRSVGWTGPGSGATSPPPTSRRWKRSRGVPTIPPTPIRSSWTRRRAVPRMPRYTPRRCAAPWRSAVSAPGMR